MAAATRANAAAGENGTDLSTTSVKATMPRRFHLALTPSKKHTDEMHAGRLGGALAGTDVWTGMAATVEMVGNAGGVLEEREALHSISTLFQEYFDELGLDWSFQDVENELKTLPGKYAQAERGVLLLVRDEAGTPVACAALRHEITPVPGQQQERETHAGDVDFAEVKRLYVRQRFRRRGIARSLMGHVVRIARDLGYKMLRLDTLERLKPVTAMYRDLGWKEIPQYCHNPHHDALFFELDISSGSRAGDEDDHHVMALPWANPTASGKEKKKKLKNAKKKGLKKHRKAKTRPTLLIASRIPDSITSDPVINAAIASSGLPTNYNFELHKTIWRLRSVNSKCVALQFPEGLLMYACIIGDLLQRFTGARPLIMGDVTYGACCVDDSGARALGADFMVHYGHSCLVPVDVSLIGMLYVFVEIRFNADAMVDALSRPPFNRRTRLVLAGTIQFASMLHAVAVRAREHVAEVIVPQAAPLSRGEVLGCTSPKLSSLFTGDETAKCALDDDVKLVFVADGRFHLESLLIHNPRLVHAYKYDPYNAQLTEERYDHDAMHALRRDAIKRAGSARRWGLILGTLGRQGNPKVLDRLREVVSRAGHSYIVVLLSEIFPEKLAAFEGVEAWVQVACPRLSIDWGYAFNRPLLSPYEAEVALQATQWRDVYPMDYYARDGGKWTNYSHRAQDAKGSVGAKTRKPVKHIEIALEEEVSSKLNDDAIFFV